MMASVDVWPPWLGSDRPERGSALMKKTVLTLATAALSLIATNAFAVYPGSPCDPNHPSDPKPKPVHTPFPSNPCDPTHSVKQKLAPIAVYPGSPCDPNH